MEPFFSIIIPTCNRNHLLGQCLDKLKPGAQTLAFDLYEVVVSDDSPGYLAEAFCRENYPWVTYTRGPQKGPAANRNNGAGLAKYGWLVFLDDDCLPDANILSAYLQAINQYPKLQVFEGVILPEGPKPDARAFAPVKDTPGFLWSCNFAISKPAFEAVRGFDEMYKYPHMEDKDLQLRLEKAGHLIHFVPASKVVHPWRALASGRTLALREEAFVYYCYKHQYAFKLKVYVRKLFFFYLSAIRQKFSLRGAFQMGYQYLQHLIIFLRHYPQWKAKYRHLLP